MNGRAGKAADSGEDCTAAWDPWGVWRSVIWGENKVDSVIIQHRCTRPSLVCGPRTPVNSVSCGEEPSTSPGVDSSSSSSSCISSDCGAGVRSSLLPEGITVTLSTWGKETEYSQATSVTLHGSGKFKMYQPLPQGGAVVLKFNIIWPAWASTDSLSDIVCNELCFLNLRNFQISFFIFLIFSLNIIYIYIYIHFTGFKKPC